ncbi:MAG: ubiquinone/menaquinone biosynthesis C-methylase UbiE [Pseudohongiellaceae bacterium]|jgi:ubiquinone/menaquinone biosynthesis C-methylase UbiE
MAFNDYFSGNAEVYAKARPTYPKQLFDYLAQVTTCHDMAWDCATGNGQTAISLGAYFDQVVATDGSAQQLAVATELSNVQYKVALAEQSTLPAESVDLITVSQALHWFDLERFFSEVDRVLKPGGVLAVWSYGVNSISQQIDGLVDELYRFTLDGYWAPQRSMVEQGYSGVQFPYQPLPSPKISLTVQWTQAQLESYLRSWSATDKYTKDKGIDPIAFLSPRLQQVWGGSERVVTWPLTLIVRRKPS